LVYPLSLVTEGAGGYNGAIAGDYGAGTAPLILGARDPQNIGKFDSYFSGKIGEIIIFNRSVRNDERKLIEKYLAKKWSLDINSASFTIRVNQSKISRHIVNSNEIHILLGQIF